jgi:hypothetical protein
MVCGAATLLCVALPCTGCRAPRGAPDAQPRSALQWHETDSAAQTWRVRWRSEPQTVEFGQPAALVVEVLPRSGPLPSDELHLRVDAGMPQHGHGTTRRPEVLALGAGRFRVEGLYLHMPGTWRIYLDIGSAGVFERAEILLEVD